ncbi:hypothetical protein G6F40_015587 [Rhizopus arrhizus]|nr:hypothetical protein G6F40_015587 [Rhizopus arrhizus]
MPLSCRNFTSRRFCRYGWISTWLVAIASAPTISIALRVCAMVKLEMPISRASPCALASASAGRYSSIGTSTLSFGDGQWISARSPRSVRSFSRLVRRLASNASCLNSGIHTLVVRYRSSRGTPDSAMAWPTSASLP